MAHLVFAEIAATHLDIVNSALGRSGYRGDEISMLCTDQHVFRSMPYAPWQLDQQQVFMCGALAAYFAQHFSATMDAALYAFGLPAYAIRQCATILSQANIVLVMSLHNSFEIEPLIEILNESGGSRPIVTICSTEDLYQAA